MRSLIALRRFWQLEDIAAEPEGIPTASERPVPMAVTSFYGEAHQAISHLFKLTPVC